MDLGAAGHVTAAGGFGPWPEGSRLLAGLRAVGRRPHALAIAGAR